MKCPVCASSDSRRMWGFSETDGKKELPLYRCRACAHAWPHPLPRIVHDVEHVYSDDPMRNPRDQAAYYGSDEFLRYTRLFAQYPAAWSAMRISGRHLDIGCGEGHLLHLSREAGMMPEGIEFHKGCVRALRKRKFTVYDKDLRALRKRLRGRYDVITANHVLEHVIDTDAFVADMRTVLNDGCHVMISVPHINGVFPFLQRSRWYGQGYGQHLHFFSRKSLRILLERNGFEVVRMETLSLDHDPPSASWPLRLALRLLVRLSVLTGTGDNLFVIARKR